ncbi:Glycoside hydrolase superfamily [Acididesulfobacillus acetoxydans]|uniref:Glycoside hydrolase superfamily n=1 Tax=Acididesulfobacillus acetoxydans TaxID=1561005 RepID=A0A8S0VX21_9FIRM|nr:MupG family TIM beta-alpha barrel fold protein [Acididesulfobacillus acetoxydans]CAA7601483.1 Glycoside hydrolase superfamily [Acididesulfobacillus acetoxydans]CEJ06138.1 Outer surface protein [Acididesulfobacillus acetoxydans]
MAKARDMRLSLLVTNRAHYNTLGSGSEIGRYRCPIGELNASTISEEVLKTIIKAGADPARLQACHNYYPRHETGLSYEFFAGRSRPFRAYGIRVSAFIPSRANPRGPIYAGLPTLEEHRHWEPLQAAKQLAACGLADGILFGDRLATAEELTDVGRVDSSLIVMAC